jgi:hypothetical protein
MVEGSAQSAVPSVQASPAFFLKNLQPGTKRRHALAMAVTAHARLVNAELTMGAIPPFIASA